MSVPFGLSLTYSLVFRIRVLCLLTHALNLALAILFTLGSS
jgi:hypothetical protein